MTICKCGTKINPILNEYPKECAVCRLMQNFCSPDCDIFQGFDCSCGGVEEVDRLLRTLRRDR